MNPTVVDSKVKCKVMDKASLNYKQAIGHDLTNGIFIQDS